MIDNAAALRRSLADRYTIDREIGRGGMAAVFLAQDIRHDRRVAIKILHPEVAAVVGPERFRREIQIAAQLTHPGILPVLDSGECADADGTAVLWYAMPFVDGESMRERMNRDRQLPIAAAVAIVRGVAEALEHAHSRGFVHRDVKPENILLHDGRPLLADFGIARAMEPEPAQRLTATGLSLGTPAYMSPEQAMAEPNIDGRADIFALGCVLYEAVIGEVPFNGPTAQAIIARMLGDVPRAISPVRPQAAWLEPIILKALARVPADRYSTAREMAEALSEAPRTISVAKRASSWRTASVVIAFIVTAGLWFVVRRRTETSQGHARIVVLPFRTTGDSARAYFTSGMTSALRTKLASIPGIDVIAATSSNAETSDPAAAAREVNATYALIGTVAWDSIGGGRISVQPQLIAARDGRSVLAWPAPVALPARQVFDVERTVTEQIARALNITLGAVVRARIGEHFGDNPAAYEQLLEADEVRGTDARRDFLLRAVALDSTLAPAWARLALANVIRYVGSADSAALIDARMQSARALALAPNLAEAHEARGMYHRTVTLQYDSAIAHLERAKSLEPGNAGIASTLASAYFNAGQLDRAMVEAQRGVGLDPKNAGALSRVVRLLLWAKDPEKAWTTDAALRLLPPRSVPAGAFSDASLIRLAQGDVRKARMALASIPDPDRRDETAVFLVVQMVEPQAIDDSTVVRLCASPDRRLFQRAPWGRHLLCAEAAVRAKKNDVARAEADTAIADLRGGVQRNRDDFSRRIHLAWALALHGDSAEAMVQADSSLATRSISNDVFFGGWNSFDYAQVAAMAGDATRSVRVLRELLAKPSPITPAWLKADPTFDKLRGDPGFKGLLVGK
ncbi:MAG: protein kinase [bacterium]